MDNLTDIQRIKELNDKSTQLLLFLSFAIVGAATLDPSRLPYPSAALLLRAAMRWWVRAMFPVLLGVLPLKDFWWPSLPWKQETWFKLVRWLKVVALFGAVLLSVRGAWRFLEAVL